MTSDARSMPFAGGTFDAVVSFLALQDVYMTLGEAAALTVIEDSCRIIKPEGTLAIADNLWSEGAQDESQRLYARIQREEFHAGLPPRSLVAKKIRDCGFVNQTEYRFNPQINLDEKESRIELLDIVEARPFGKTFNFEKIWTESRHDIRRVGLSYPDILMIRGTKTIAR